MNLIFYCAMLLVFVSYISFIWLRYGVQPSISESYYRLPKKYNFLFTFFCWGFAFPVIIMGVPITPLLFFAGVGICFVGAAAAFKQDLVDKVHSTAAVLGILFSQLAITFSLNLPYLSLATILLIGLLYLLKIRNRTWWVEITAFISITLALLKLL